MPGGGMMPPVQSDMTPGPGGVVPQNGATPAPGLGMSVKTSTAATPDTAVWPFALAGSGLACPQVEGYTCFLRFNVPSPAPTPKHGKSTATASPSPSPSPSPSADPSGSPKPTASPAELTLVLQALPKDAPALPNPDTKARATTPLLALRMHVNADVTINGAVRADFTLPPNQVAGRGFAIGLFQETVSGKKRHRDDRYFGSYSKSTVSADTLHFTVTPPSIGIKKDEVWLFVLYGDDRPNATPSPVASGAASAPPASPPPPASPNSSASPLTPLPTSTPAH
jgi:hypothetical protein